MKLPRHILKYGLVTAALMSPAFASTASFAEGGASDQQVEADCGGSVEQADSAQRGDAPATRPTHAREEAERDLSGKQAAVVGEEETK